MTLLPRRPAADEIKTSSLRLRVVFSVLALVIALLVGLGLIVNTVLRDRLQSDLHQRLRERAGLAQALAGQGLTDQQLSDRLTGAGITAAVSSASGIVVGRDQPPPNAPGNGQRPPRRFTPAAAASSVAITQEGPRLTARLTVDSRPVTLTTSVFEIQRTLATLTRIEIGAGLALLLLLALLLWRVVGAALSPLDRMSALARHIGSGARGRRLRPSRPQTELGRTAVAFDAMLDSLESAEAQSQRAEVRMRQFLADASHDLRTPIAGVITTAERVLRDNPTRAEREERLVELIREAQRASRLVDDLLLMARLDDDAEPTSAEMIDVGALARRAVLLAQDRGPSRTFSAETATVGPFVRADADALHRTVANLLDNARNATAPGGQVLLRVFAQGSTVSVDVCDDGPGVAPEDQGRIFDRFVRLDPGRTGSGASTGSGLGLPIARALTRRQGGELSYVRGPGNGSAGATFRITLPAVSAPAPMSEGQDVVVAAVVDGRGVVAHV